MATFPIHLGRHYWWMQSLHKVRLDATAAAQGRGSFDALTPIVLFSCHYFYVNPLNEGQNAMSELFRGVTAKGKRKLGGKQTVLVEK